MSLPLYILLCSGEHEKIQMAAMMSSVAAASERRVEVFLSMNAMYAFAREAPAAGRYRGGQFAELFKGKNIPDAMSLFEMAKDVGECRVWACSMAMGLLEWEVEDMVPGIVDGAAGLTKFMADAEAGQLISL